MTQKLGHPPFHPSRRESRDRDVWEIIRIMTEFEKGRSEAMLLPTDPVPDQWSRNKEAEAIYDFMVKRGE